MEKSKIFVVEDDEDLSYIMKMQLERNGYQVICAASCREAEMILKREPADLILMDVMLPDGDGVELLKKIRKETFTPVIFVSCISGQETVIEALKNGGDDFVTKPVEMEVLLARIESNIRRSRAYGKGIGNEEVMNFRQFKIDQSKHKVWQVDEEGKVKGKLHLSPIEYKLLEMFISNIGKLLTYEEIYQYVWKTDDLGDVRTVMVHVSNLRKKINYLDNDMIQTVRGTGYAFYDR